ncbi:MAG: 50S ribosomal protein L4 [Thaumarchaeota archaeon]|nr:50S ribosomal protein L4 [Nitrososphaerota archaeon]RNJ73402.1 MAG: 50S ribosomal protein L4 [Thaumarchaeota archaeon S15]RNJ73574.1 MAG: 50S ribosomal protein L4 [Thaumarchaeota archaeon S13]MDD9812909.1 50S ribosomal protein L4 [Nitrososphaerota archaeon]MDD9825713.1 50S ribosomal protein L4 [Nitrososphaerota archaeon]
MAVAVLRADGTGDGEVELPRVFETPVRGELIARAYTIMNTRHFQPKGTHPTAGMDVVARTANPPTGQGQSRIARIRTSGGRRQGEAAGVASVRGGRQAHPPKAERVIHKRINRKERRLALCSAIAATADRSLVASRGHRVPEGAALPLVVSDDVEATSTAKGVRALLGALGLYSDVERLLSRARRSGKPALRGRTKKVGKSVLFVTGGDPGTLSRACGAVPGVEVRRARDLSVLDLAPGASPSRLTVYTRAAISEIASIPTPHLEAMGAPQ